MTAISGSVTMRRAGPGDAKAIATLTNAAYIKYIPRIGRQPRPMTENYSQVLLEHPVWLLMLSDRPVGVLVLMLEHEAMLIYSVAVDPKYQKRGLGRRLLRHGGMQHNHEHRSNGHRHFRPHPGLLTLGRCGFTCVGCCRTLCYVNGHHQFGERLQ